MILPSLHCPSRCYLLVTEDVARYRSSSLLPFHHGGICSSVITSHSTTQLNRLTSLTEDAFNAPRLSVSSPRYIWMIAALLSSVLYLPDEHWNGPLLCGMMITLHSPISSASFRASKKFSNIPLVARRLVSNFYPSFREEAQLLIMHYHSVRSLHKLDGGTQILSNLSSAGSQPELQSELARHDEGKILEQFIDLAIRLDNLLHSR